MKQKPKPDSEQISRVLIQPDARGRIQLPSHLREFDIFELCEINSNNEGPSHTLHGIKVPTHKTSNPKITTSSYSPTERWLPKEVSHFLKNELFPKIQSFCEAQNFKSPFTLCLFGSQAREDATTKSDFDFAFISSQSLSFKERRSFSESFDTALSDEIKVLKSHQITGDFSLVFLDLSLAHYPPLYFSIATEAKVIFDSSNNYSLFYEKITERMKKLKVKKTKIAGLNTWSWDYKKEET